MFRKSVLQSILFLFPILFYAQTYPFANYGVKEGLSQSNVSGIIQDSAGFYWLATESGVSRFDGKEFTSYTTENGLADNNVSAIFLDKNNKIWLGHENGSLTYYDGTSFSQIKSKLLPNDKKIYGFYQDGSGALWIATASSGTIKIIDPSKGNTSKLHIRVYSGKDGLSQYVLSVVEDKQRTHWFLTDIGIKFLKRGKQEFEFFRSEGLPPGQVSCLAMDKNSNLLIGSSSGGISRYNPITNEFQALVTSADLDHINESGTINFVYSILEDTQGNIWASLYNYGVCRYEPATKKVTVFNVTNGLAVNKIKSISEDREGNILFGTLGEGMQVFAGEKFISFSKRDGLVDKQVWAVCEDTDGNYWFGTNEGITIYQPGEKADKAFKTLTTADGLPSNNIRAIVADKNGDLWIGTWGGKTVKYDHTLSKLVTVPALSDIVNNYVSCLTLDKKNNLWIGTIEGIVKYDIGSQVIRTIRTINGLTDNDVTAICEDFKGRMWIGTKQKGVTLIDGKNSKKLSKADGLTYNSITSIAEDSRHHIWIGTAGGGAFVYDQNKFIHYRKKDGLVSDYVTLISSDHKNKTWLGTNRGLNKFDPDKNSFSLYGPSEGFTGVETKSNAGYLDKKGNVWFGTVNGVFKYSPEKDIPVLLEPIVKLTRFTVNLKDYPIEDKVTLSYQKNSLHFDFVGISLSNPAGVTYKIKLEGYEKDWKPATKQNFEIYSNLPPNHYAFKLIACNSSGVCSSKPLTMDITITPPFWKTWWFYLLISFVVSSGLFLYIKLRERKLRQEKKILEEKVVERTEEVVKQKHIVEEKQKEIMDSISYAKRLQEAILPPQEFLNKNLLHNFVLYLPKDIVAGDFYWSEKIGDDFYIAAADSTGHGVPGAMVSVVCSNALNRAVKEFGLRITGEILDKTRELVIETFEKSESEVKDGMDISLLRIKKLSNGDNEIQWSGAYNALWYFEDDKFKEIKANKQPIGKHSDPMPFTSHSISLSATATMYLFSDGYADQFSPRDKKLMTKKFKEILGSIQNLSISEQGEFLKKHHLEWKGDMEQTDDVLVIGIKV
jgi:ligand-binding sensor domain-containing protein/serine phosphatase RsbU (regulator of sigma subunit)